MRDQYFRKANVIKVIDGDTVDVRIDLGWGLTFNERLRLIGIDTPEVRGVERSEGLKYRIFVINWLSSWDYIWIESHEYDRGKYGRTLATIYSPTGENLNEILKEMINGISTND